MPVMLDHFRGPSHKNFLGYVMKTIWIQITASAGQTDHCLRGYKLKHFPSKRNAFFFSRQQSNLL